MTTRVLLLGGTAEARELAAALVDRPDTIVVSSLAGRVADPRLPVGEVRIGGFGGPAGLARWLDTHRIDVLVDATHPYAARMRSSAVRAAGETGVPYLRLERPGWTEGPGDRWHRVPDLDAAAELVPRLGRRAFVTTGRQGLAAFLHLTGAHLLVRVVDEPTIPLPENVTVLRDRGPYRVTAERELLTAHRIDVLVSKDSGGTYTMAKLDAARDLGLPVVLVDRPAPVALPATVTEVAAALAWLETAPPRR
ncbi:cobalt-precorrin-6A reductase [Plantactinospora endophytica]|uniref:Precorrin-6A reductase n=1 Tax=Plantactinospora endophytica TaxID=673535 RepID=A0ABQ4E1M3_9ACTN|nr:cobalt-precorrin-6A reductase [Plantactinospora endophytica]GIG88603.1 precorrin-6A reductase [Plantactinospora endophytica]